MKIEQKIIIQQKKFIEDEIYIFGHRRSGNHFLAELLIRNFGIQFNQNKHKSHSLVFDVSTIPNNSLYLVRDGRDVLVSCYYWWKSTKGAGPAYQDKTFSDYLHGLSVDELLYYDLNYHDVELWLDPIMYWVKHVTGWLNFIDELDILLVKYEDLKLDLGRVMNEIESKLRLNKLKPNYIGVGSLVGHAPRKGIIGDWKNHFNDADLNLFFDKAGEVMERLGYV